MSCNVAISINDLSKNYRIYSNPLNRIRQKFTFNGTEYYKNFAALNGISFEVKKGESVGILGRNGSGKSTLLQIVCGIRKPTSGAVEVNGRISALLELGAGFHPEFTGRENVYMQGAIMGISRDEMDHRFEEIAKFADIGEFIEQPVKVYSSGMFVRLAFAVAVSVDANLLIVDEALGVGDMEFQERSISRMKEMRERGTTILFVSHSLPMLRNFCERVIWLQNGRIVMDGKSSEVCIAYQKHMTHLTSPMHPQSPKNAITGHSMGRMHHASGRQKSIVITNVILSKNLLQVGDELAISVALSVTEEEKLNDGFGLGILIHNSFGKTVAIFNSIRDDVVFTEFKPLINLHITSSSLVPERYSLSVNICDKNGLYAYDTYDHCAFFEVAQEYNSQGIPRWEGEAACEHIWN